MAPRALMITPAQFKAQLEASATFAEAAKVMQQVFSQQCFTCGLMDQLLYRERVSTPPHYGAEATSILQVFLKESLKRMVTGAGKRT